MLIYPSLLSINKEKLKEELDALKKAKADGLHYDVMDGKFVPNKFGGIKLLNKVKKISDLPINIQLMVQDNEKEVKKYIKAKPQGLCFHIETTKNPIPLLKLIKENKIQAGLTIDLPTPLEKIKPFLKDLDFVLVMTVKAGAGGQKFDEYGLQKAKEIKKLYPKLPIHMDGGITIQTAKLCKKTAHLLDVGSAIFKSNDYKKIISDLRN